MVSTLYAVPFVHEYPSSYLYLGREPPKDCIQEAEKRIEELMKNIKEKVKNKKIDVIFLEGNLRSYNVEDIDSSNLGPTHRGVYEIAKEKNARIEKTEDKKFYYFCKKWIPITDNLRNIPVLGTVAKKVNCQFRNRRDYEMGKNVSKKLKDGKNGIIFHGRLHRPSKYVRLLSPSIEIKPVFDEDEFFLK